MEDLINTYDSSKTFLLEIRRGIVVNLSHYHLDGNEIKADILKNYGVFEKYSSFKLNKKWKQQFTEKKEQLENLISFQKIEIRSILGIR